MNFARDVLVVEEAVVDALVARKDQALCDGFSDACDHRSERGDCDPASGGLYGRIGRITVPEWRQKEIRSYLEHGNIRHSVNYPDSDMGFKGENTRILLLHHNIPNMLGQFTRILAEDNINIADLSNKSKGGYAYTMIDIDSEITQEAIEELKAVKDVLKVRVIR